MATAEVIEIGQQLESKALTWAQKAKCLVIQDQGSLDAASEMLSVVVALKREAIAHHKPIKEASWKAHQVSIAAEKRVVQPLEEAEGILRPSITKYLTEQERIRLEAERKAREEAARLAREAEEARQAEIRRLEEEARRIAEEQKLADAVQAESEGAAPEEVVAILEQPTRVAFVAPPPPPVQYVAPVVASTVQRTAGISAPRENWSAEVTNMAALIQYVSENPQYGNLLLPNTTALNQMAKAQRNLLCIPGVQAKNNPNISVRR